MQEIKNETEFNETIEKNGNSLVLVLFSAKFANKESSQIKESVDELIKSAQPNSIIGFFVDADNCDALVKKMSIQCVPSVLVYAKSKQVDKIEGTDIVVLINSIKESIIKNYPLVADIGSGQTSSKASLENRLKKLINSSDLMIFMKGSRSAPRCGFSKQIIAILNSLEANYETFDILNDEDVRQGLKTFSNWPTYPQVYFKGQLIGGLDIIKQLHDTGEFEQMIKS